MILKSDIYTKIALLLFLYFFLSFFFVGITSVPSEGDSLAYHIPIARSIIDGTVWNPPRDGYALGFYPGSAEMILSLFIYLHLPLNLYNVLGWTVLAYVSYLLGIRFGLTRSLSIVFAVCQVTVLSVIRLILTQTIDIWLAVFFGLSLLFISNPQKSVRYFLLLGIALGLLIGSKFSGPVYALVLFLFWGRSIMSVLTLKRLIVFIVPIMVFGLSWYVRNYLVTGNPFYPQGLLFLPGNPSFELMNWTGWQTVFFYPNGVFLMLGAFFSEYLLWSIAPCIGIIYLMRQYPIRTLMDEETRQLIMLGLLNALIFFFLPSTGNNIITYLRYLFPAFMPLILSLFLLSNERKMLDTFVPLALVNSMVLISFTPHRPKVLFVYLICAGILLIKYDILKKYLKHV